MKKSIFVLVAFMLLSCGGNAGGERPIVLKISKKIAYIGKLSYLCDKFTKYSIPIID